MPGRQLVDPAEDRPQELVEGGKCQVRFALGGPDAEGGVSVGDRQFRAG
jgi:hypothetical protein